MDLNNYVSQDTLGNIYNRQKNMFGVVSNIKFTLRNNKCFGKVVLFINVTSKKKIVMNDIVEFNPLKIIWSSTNFDSDGNTLHLINPYWCKLYYVEPKIHVPVKVLLHDYNKDTGEIKYFNSVENMYMTRAQFVKRCLLQIFGSYSYREIAACENMAERWWELKDYYRAHNETVKNYSVEGDHMKTLYSKFTNAKKEINKKWDKLLIKHYQQNAADKQIQAQIDNFKDKQKSNNIIDFNEFKVLLNH